MSERGSFVTDYIYCDQCLIAALAILQGNAKHLCSCVVPSWEDGEKNLPIIAGKLGGLYGGEEINDMRDRLQPLADQVCHPLRVVVCSDHGDVCVFGVRPQDGVTELSLSDLLRQSNEREKKLLEIQDHAGEASAKLNSLPRFALIWSHEHRGWWKPHEHGYTDNKEEAGVYPIAKARAIVYNANRYLVGGSPNEALIPCDQKGNYTQ